MAGLPVDPNYTPPAPSDPYQGAEGSVERQKQALVQLLAEQGSYGAKQLDNRGNTAAALGQSAQAATNPAAPMNANTQALYDVFNRDAAQSKLQDTQNQSRVQAANQAYMNQATAAIPLDRQANDQANTNAKMQYEEAQRQRQADLEAQQLATQRAAAAAAASSSNNQSYYQKAQEKSQADIQLLLEQLKGQAPMDRKWSDISQAGIQGEPNNPDEVSKSFGWNGDPATYQGRTGAQAGAAKRLVGAVVQDAQNTGASFRQVVQAAMNASADPATKAQYGLRAPAGGASSDAILQHIMETYLAGYAGQWGLSPADLGFKYYSSPDAVAASDAAQAAALAAPFPGAYRDPAQNSSKTAAKPPVKPKTEAQKSGQFWR